MFDFITSTIEATGALGIALLMFLENVFPPIPSELIMPLAGYNASRGAMSLWTVILSGTAGSLAGALFWYWIGLRFGAERLKRLACDHGRFLTVTPDDIDRATGWFHRHGAAAVLFGRLLPTIRTLISVPAGIARMPLWKVAALSAIGTGIWTAILTLLGYWLGASFRDVEAWLNPVSTGIVILLVLIYIWRVIRFDPERARAEMAPGEQSG